MAISVIIGGVDVTDYYLSYKKTLDTENAASLVELKLKKTVDTVLTLAIGQLVDIVRDGSYRVRNGEIYTDIEKQGGVYSVKIATALYKAAKYQTSISYDKDIDTEAGVGSEIWKDLMERTGFTVGQLYVPTSTGSTTNLLRSKIIIREESVIAATRKELCDCYGYVQFYSDSEDLVYFVPRGYSIFSTSAYLTRDARKNVLRVPSWNYDGTEMFNYLTVIGAKRKDLRSQSFTGDGATKNFSLTAVPVEVKITVAGVLKTQGIPNSTTTYDYSVDDDPEHPRIMFVSAPAGAAAIVCEYYYYINAPVIVRDETSKTNNSNGEWVMKKIIKPKLTNPEDALLYGQKMLSAYKDPFKQTSILVEYDTFKDILPSNLLNFTDEFNNETVVGEVSQIVETHPSNIMEITLGDKSIKTGNLEKNTDDRIKELEDQLRGQNDILIQELTYDYTFTPQQRDFSIVKEVFDLDLSGIYGHPIAGVYGTAVYGYSYSTPIETVKLVQGDMTYREHMYDDDYHDSINSTATFNTGTKTISFTAGQVWYSKVIDLGTIVSNIKVTLGTTTGTLTIEISSDNKLTWQTVSNNTLTAVSSSDGTGTFIRITSAGVGTITNTTSSSGQITAPAVSVYMGQ